MDIFKYGAEPRYTIQEAAAILGLSKPTIRYYEEIGLLNEVQRDKNNIRLFSDDNLMRLRMIQCIRNSGMGIEKVREYIGLSTEELEGVTARYDVIREQERLLLERKAELDAQLAFIEHKKQVYEEKLDALHHMN
ncbi:MerR family transcriptional regulator [Paenibacillus sp. NFR01]|uniref:MerR family transcriptional regulator n=1 Tax=Paenibacillus sp. NFR01 TaxID=1566279 RepID=UPI0008B60D2A|nr:MerR family transcriptional regulator [Paenibacillus sp. NFR01]SET12092.1 DNA-binding transcriptional regulator, MerR family [Paenibacillus sp. NFR01]